MLEELAIVTSVDIAVSIALVDASAEVVAIAGVENCINKKLLAVPTDISTELLVTAELGVCTAEEACDCTLKVLATGELDTSIVPLATVREEVWEGLGVETGISS